MAGTDSAQRGLTQPAGGPAVVLVGPQLGENVGAVARAMMNCALGDLRLVNPRDGWPNPKAVSMASGADVLLDEARLFDDVQAAVGDLHYVLATTARHRDMVKHELTPASAAAEIRRREAAGERCGILFGPERIGLTNEEVVLADAILHVPLNPAFSSLNLAQAVLLVVYQYFQAGDDTPSRQIGGEHESAPRERLLNFFAHLEEALDSVGFFRSEALRPTLVQNLRNVFHRAELSEREIRSLHGVVTRLVGRHRRDL